MRQWTLINDSEAPVGDGILFAQNVSIDTTGELRRRDGLRLLTATGAVLIGPNFDASTGYAALLVTSTGSIVSVVL